MKFFKVNIWVWIILIFLLVFLIPQYVVTGSGWCNPAYSSGAGGRCSFSMQENSNNFEYTISFGDCRNCYYNSPDSRAKFNYNVVYTFEDEIEQSAGSGSSYKFGTYSNSYSGSKKVKSVHVVTTQDCDGNQANTCEVLDVGALQVNNKESVSSGGVSDYVNTVGQTTTYAKNTISDNNTKSLSDFIQSISDKLQSFVNELFGVSGK